MVTNYFFNGKEGRRQSAFFVDEERSQGPEQKADLWLCEEEASWLVASLPGYTKRVNDTR